MREPHRKEKKKQIEIQKLIYDLMRRGESEREREKTAEMERQRQSISKLIL